MATRRATTKAASEPTRKTPDPSTEDTKPPAKPDPQAKDTSKAAQTYTERAAVLADEVRAAADAIRDQVETVNGKVLELQQAMMPNPGEARVAGGVRRIPMATSDVTRAVEGLAAAAVDLQRRAT